MESSPTQKIWFYESGDGKRIGPVHDSEMHALVKNGRIPRGTLIWCPDYPNWCPIESTELHSALAEAIIPPELPPPISNLAWVLAFMPILGFIIERFVWVIFTPSFRLFLGYSGKYFFISMIINCILIGVDAWLIKQTGRDIKKLWGGLILVPLYLFQRKKLLNQDNTYFIVWFVCFACEIALFILT